MEVVFTFHATGAPPLTWNAPKKELDSEDDWGFQRCKPSACVNELTEYRFVAVQKLREKKLVSEVGVGVVSASPGELLDPVNDLIERFASVLLEDLTWVMCQDAVAWSSRHMKRQGCSSLAAEVRGLSKGVDSA